MSRLLAGVTATGVLATLVVSMSTFSTAVKTVSVSATSALPTTTQTIAKDGGLANNVSVSATSYRDAVSFFAKRAVVLSVQPGKSFSYATWNTVTDDTDEVLQASAVLQAEFNKYPQDYLQTAGLKKIYLVNKLAINGQYRSGMPEPSAEQALYFDISPIYQTSEGGVYMRRVYHHELNHLIEYVRHGTYAPNTNWAICNPDGFRYGSGGSSMYADPAYAHAPHPVDGFVNGYATSGQEEDMAEVYAEYLTNRSSLLQLSQTDTHIACKVAQTTKLIQSIK